MDNEAGQYFSSPQASENTDYEKIFEMRKKTARDKIRNIPIKKIKRSRRTK